MTSSGGHTATEHPVREKMLELKAAGENVADMSLPELAAALDIESVSVVNYHLNVLKARWQRSSD